MKLSDMAPLMEGVFQLEEGHGEWNADQCEAVVIAFAGSEAKLDLNKFEKDQEVFLPSSLDDGRLKHLEVHSEGWYVEPASERVEELVPVIYEFLPEMLVGQKVMLFDNGGKEHEGKTYVVKLISVHEEARPKLSPQEKNLVDAVRKVKPRKETDWIDVAAIYVHGIWGEVMEKFEAEQRSTRAAVEEAKTSDISEIISSSTESSEAVPLDPLVQRLKTAVLGAETKKKSDLESNIDTENTLAHRTPRSGLAIPPLESQETKGIEHSSKNRKRWSLFLG